MANGNNSSLNLGLGKVGEGPDSSAPPLQEIVTSKVLYDRRLSSSTLARAFAGTTDPTTIWLSLISDQQDAFSYMRELEEKDEDVGSAMEQLKLAVIRRPWNIVAYDDSPQATDISEFITTVFSRIKCFNNWRWAALSSPGYGVTVSEIMWQYAEVNGRYSVIIDEIRDVPQELFNFNPPGFMQNGPLRLLPNMFDPYGGTLVPEDKFVVWSYNPTSGNRKGSPLIRKVFWPSWFKRQAIRFWLKFGEKGPGTAVTTYKNGATQSERDEALAAAEALIEQIALAVPENFSVIKELLTTTRSQDPAVYEKLVQRMEDSIYRRIKGETLTSHGSEGGYGSRALGSVHEDTFQEKWSAVCVSMMEVVNEALIKPLVLWNFGPASLTIMPSFVIDIEDSKDQVSMVAVHALLQKMGVKFSENWIRNTYGIPEIQDGDAVLEPLAPTATGPGGEAGGGGIPSPTIPAPTVPPPGGRGRGGGGGGTTYADDGSPLVIRSARDVQRLMEQLRAESSDVFRQRILALVEEARQRQGK